MILREKGTVRLIACGGAACNIAKNMSKESKGELAGQGRLKMTFVDTSNSNLINQATINESDIYLITGLDGAGQDRGKNIEAVNAHVPPIVEFITRQGDADLNIILCSFSGGSGSIIGPLLGKRLLAEGQSVVVIGIGDMSTWQYAKNTHGTIMTLDKMARDGGFPFITQFFYNEGSATHKAVDGMVENMVHALRVLYSNNNEGLDSTDLKNWLRHPSIENKLMCLSVVMDNETLNPDYGNAISVATLGSSGQKTDFNGLLNYQTTGIYTQDVGKFSENVYHFVVSDGYFDKIAETYKKRLEEHERVKQNSLVKNPLSGNAKADSSGIVL